MSTVHIVGAGMAGLACAVRLATGGRRVALYDAAPRAGGRCRSFHDARLDRIIDNGNHLLLSANTAVLDYLAEIGSEDSLMGPARARFPFVDVRTGERWTVEPSEGPVPWWVLSRGRRIPGTRVRDYLSACRLARASGRQTVAQVLPRRDPMWERFWEPLTLAVLNTESEAAAATLLWRVVRETFGRGEVACRPMIARRGLADSLVDPAVERLKTLGGAVHFGHRLRGLADDGRAVTGLDFGARPVPVREGDCVVLAVAPANAIDLMPSVEAPEDSRPIVNAHFRVDDPPAGPEDTPFLGLIGGTAQWLFLRGDVVSITVSAATALVEEPADRIAALLWRDVAYALERPSNPLPPYRIVKERRATFAQTPAALARRPGLRTRFANLLLAGDWTDTGLPATIDGAVRSGHAAAAAVLHG